MKAFLFDLNGTVIDDMEFHGQAWFEILNNSLGAKLSYEEVKKEMYGKNQELLVRVFGKDRFTQEQMDTLSVEKEKKYQAAYKPHLRLIKGLGDFFNKAEQLHIPMAIGSAAIPFNIDFVLDNLAIRHYFKAIVSSDDVLISKPHPETFTKCADLLDAPKGVEAAKEAGMKAVVITTYHQPEHFAHLDNVLLFVGDYTDERLTRLFS
ncbi:HAD-superfamily hydrolase, subfamily IA, variant 3 [Russula earlei]|uniref:HAD-superfamily hydrolase, subfamily IA, variant 3 n=1 Tax=Russula earlei TaxID=71964 RepID=A0ACC0TV27_9AGAM|nr:HAD-superfamily hydrolase, subfamily IA, variant 3 [Russula earlei]